MLGSGGDRSFRRRVSIEELRPKARTCRSYSDGRKLEDSVDVKITSDGCCRGDVWTYGKQTVSRWPGGSFIYRQETQKAVNIEAGMRGGEEEVAVATESPSNDGEGPGHRDASSSPRRTDTPTTTTAGMHTL